MKSGGFVAASCPFPWRGPNPSGGRRKRRRCCEAAAKRPWAFRPQGPSGRETSCSRPQCMFSSLQQSGAPQLPRARPRPRWPEDSQRPSNVSASIYASTEVSTFSVSVSTKKATTSMPNRVSIIRPLTNPWAVTRRPNCSAVSGLIKSVRLNEVMFL